MNTADQVATMIQGWIDDVKVNKISISDAVWNTAIACVGWSYVYGAWGAECTPSERRKRLGYHPEKTEISKKCQVLNGSASRCSGCKWYPQDHRTRCFDCRGFTDWCLNQFNQLGVVDLYGDSVGAQWKADKNWTAKGTIDSIPDNVLVCLFVYNKDKQNWQHTGLGYKGMTCECSSGVQFFDKRKSKWSHWAIPRGIGGDIPPMPDTKPTLRRGDSGPYVTLMQTDLVKRGYDVGSSGIDGKFGKQTENALKAFQKDAGLVPDGVCGPLTWAALEDAPSTLYTVTIPHLSASQADAPVVNYPGAYMTQEGG